MDLQAQLIRQGRYHGGEMRCLLSDSDSECSMSRPMHTLDIVLSPLLSNSRQIKTSSVVPQSLSVASCVFGTLLMLRYVIHTEFRVDRDACSWLSWQVVWDGNVGKVNFGSGQAPTQDMDHLQQHACFLNGQPAAVEQCGPGFSELCYYLCVDVSDLRSV